MNAIDKNVKDMLLESVDNLKLTANYMKMGKNLHWYDIDVIRIFK
jgi:hypothetical protein